MYTKCGDRTATLGYDSYVKTDAHKGEVKYGEHWYKESSYIISPVDRFADEFNESVEEIKWAGMEAGWWYGEALDLGDVIRMAFSNFNDNGESFRKSYALA